MSWPNPVCLSKVSCSLKSVYARAWQNTFLLYDFSDNKTSSLHVSTNTPPPQSLPTESDQWPHRSPLNGKRTKGSSVQVDLLISQAEDFPVFLFTWRSQPEPPQTGDPQPALISLYFRTAGTSHLPKRVGHINHSRFRPKTGLFSLYFSTAGTSRLPKPLGQILNSRFRPKLAYSNHVNLRHDSEVFGPREDPSTGPNGRHENSFCPEARLLAIFDRNADIGQ